MPTLDLFAPGTAPVLALFGARMSGLMLVAPVFSARTVPAMVKAGLVVLLTLLLAPAAQAHVAQVPTLTPAGVLGEVLVGFAIGLGAALLVGAAEAAGELMAIQIGLSGAAILDPSSNTNVPALGQLMQLTALALLLNLDLHLVMLDAVAASARVIPVGAQVDAAAGAYELVRAGGMLFMLGLRFAAPVVAAVLIANVALAVLSKAAPQLNVLQVAFPIQIAIGLAALAASIPLIATFFSGWTGPYDGLVGRVLEAMR
ncbi:MAG TPA: flagellar biosynthetic protein FliR [Gemmatimonadales bacterium]